MMMESFSQPPFDPVSMIRPGRSITGISAILLPFNADHSVDWESFRSHIQRTSSAGITPAINMDTGYANLIDEATRQRVLDETRDLVGGAFVAGAFVSDQPGARFDLATYARQIDSIQQRGGTPVIFQSYGLTEQSPDAIIASYEAIGQLCERFIAFELGTMFVPFGRIYDLETYQGLMSLSKCQGAKHSSLRRDLEWQRLALRDQHRPDFKVYTGNDLAIDMVMYGSDYLLGLSTFAPDLFARRDAMWAASDPDFYALNDLLQYLGFFVFRAPVPAYKHSAAQFLALRGWLKTDLTHPNSPTRPDADLPILRDIAQRLGLLEA